MRTKPTVITRRAGNVLVHQRQWLGQRNTAKDNFLEFKGAICDIILSARALRARRNKPSERASEPLQFL